MIWTRTLVPKNILQEEFISEKDTVERNSPNYTGSSFSFFSIPFSTFNNCPYGIIYRWSRNLWSVLCIAVSGSITKRSMDIVKHFGTQTRVLPLYSKKNLHHIQRERNNQSWNHAKKTHRIICICPGIITPH